MKKLLSLLLVVVMSLGMLTACGNGQQETNEDNTGNSEVSEGENGTEQESNGEVVQVTYWNTASGEKTFVEEIVEEFNTTIGKENNVEIVLEHVESSSAEQEIGVALQNGVGPDIFSSNSFTEYVEKGYVTPLTEVPGVEELVEKNSSVMSIGDNVWQDNVYRVATSTTILGLVYNKDMFVAAGIVDENGDAKPPTTIDEMVEYAKILTDVSNQQYGFGFPLGWGNTVVNHYIGYPSQSVTGFVNGIYDYKTGMYNFEGVRPLAEAYLQMKEDGSIYPGAESLDNDAARARFAEGSIGMMMTVQWDCAVWNDQFPAKCDWEVVPIPVENEAEAYQQYTAYGWTGMVNAKGIEEGRGEAIGLVFNYLYGDDMVIRRAEEGMSVPMRAELVEQCDFSGSPKGWEDYCELINVSASQKYLTKNVDLDGLDEYRVEFINNVWSGEQSLDEWIVAMTERYNEGASRYIENASEDVAMFEEEKMDPNFDISR